MTCEGCGKGFRPKQRWGRFCGPRCRVAAWYRRRAEEAVTAQAEEIVNRCIAALDEVLQDPRR